jgi:hypothetical protein
MPTNKHIDEIILAYKDGKINDYMRKKLLSAMENGISDDLSCELIEDGQNASDFGVNSDRDYTVYFFIGHIVDDILNDTFGIKLEPNKKIDLSRFLFSHKDNAEYKLNDLTDYRILIHKWLCGNLTKKAHPNTFGISSPEPKCNVDRWITTLKNIYNAVNSTKTSRAESIKYFTNGWDADEKQKFVNWMRYYEDGTTEKYNVKNAKLMKQALELDLPIPQNWTRQDGRGTDQYMSTHKIDPVKTKRELELEQAKLLKMKMRSRLLAFKKLLDRYNDILPKQNIENVYNEIYMLDKSISKLDVFASVQDCIIRSANRIRKFGFIEGAEILEKTAAEPAVGQDVMSAIPKGISDQPNLPIGAGKTFSIKTIIDRLEGLSKILKSRDMIRELASIDILLNELGMASYFPELTDAQAKLIEAYGYASNKAESMIAKLRGSGTSKTKAPAIKAPVVKAPPIASPSQVNPPGEPINTEELMSKPVSNVKRELPKESPAAPVAPKKPE